MKALRFVLIAGVALVLAAALGFLYFKTEALDLKQRNDILGTLREIKEIDSKWDLEALRLRVEPGAVSPTAELTARQLTRAQTALQAAATSLASPALSNGVPQLQTALTEKAALVEQYRIHNAAAKAAFDDLVTTAGEPVPGKTGPGLAELARRAYAEPDTEHSAQLMKAAQAAVEPTTVAATQLVQARTRESELFRKLSFLSAGPRVDSLTNAFNRELENALEDKERWRVYLIYFAGALLVLLGYVGQQLAHSYRTLDRRVADRTRELSAAMKQLQESEAQLIQSEKMSSLGQMVAGVVHEINTPLAYVKNSLGTVKTHLPEITQTVAESDNFMQVLAAGTATEEALSAQFSLARERMDQFKQAHTLDEMNALVGDGLYGIEQISDLVTNLKDFSRLDRSKTQSFDLNEGLTSTLLLARHLLKKVEVHKEFATLPPIVCSPSQINQVFLNLVTNAVQAMERPDGVITLKSRVVDAQHVAVDVEDNGNGIPADVLPKIFDPFFTTKAPGQGTGLGLSISYKIVAEHGGRIEAHSTPGKGTRFTVTLPLQPPPATPGNPPARAEATPAPAMVAQTATLAPVNARA